MKKADIILIRNAQQYDFGGGERFPVFLAEVLANNQVEPLVVSRNAKLLDFAKQRNLNVVRGWWWNNQHWSGARVVLFPIYALWQFVLYVWYLRLFRATKPVAVHVQSKDDFIAATYAAKTVGSRVIWTDHADLKHVWQNLQSPFKNPIGKWVYRAAKKADTITVVSQSEFDEVTRHLPERSQVLEKIEVVYNGVIDDYDRYKDVALNENFTFSVINRLVTDKGITEAIDAFTKLQQDFPNTDLVFIGSGPEEDKFREQANNNSHIVFAGYQSNPLSFVAKSHVVLQPTYHEGFSVALVEASMMKKPIIATRVGGNVEIIHDHETGLLVDARNSESLYDAMKLLIEDATLRDALASNARVQYVEKFMFDTIVKERFMKLYEKNSD
jgi:glycosyltransferase involved in cell wall biosynthesis